MKKSGEGKAMKSILQLRRTAAWLAVWALPLAYANVGLALAAVDFDLATFGDFERGFRMIVTRPDGAGLVRWSMITDMLGFYLMLVPLALVLWDWLKGKNQQLITVSTLFGLGYLFFGAVGAAILSVVLPDQLNAYAQTAVAERPIHQAIFLVFSSAIYDGVWGTLNPLLGGVWWVGVGAILRHQRRALGWTIIVLGVFMLLRDVKIGPVELIGLSVYFVLAPICAAWLGVDLLRKPG
jgi:hypothetical protein